MSKIPPRFNSIKMFSIQNLHAGQDFVGDALRDKSLNVAFTLESTGTMEMRAVIYEGKKLIFTSKQTQLLFAAMLLANCSIRKN